MKRIASVSMVVVVALFLALAAPALAGGDLELRVTENLRPSAPTFVGSAPVPQPVIVDRPAQDMTVFDSFGVFQAPRAR